MEDYGGKVTAWKVRGKAYPRNLVPPIRGLGRSPAPIGREEIHIDHPEPIAQAFRPHSDFTCGFRACSFHLALRLPRLAKVW
jgi:hypothetical protein